jgi:predicted ATP-dependent endonuclease of OLD family
MRLKKLRIINFRCFRQFEIDLDSNVTVLFGKNGAGKSTLIDAIHKALSFVFITDKNYRGFLLADGIKSLRPENYSEEQDFLLDVETGQPVKEIAIVAEAEINQEHLTWSMQASTQTYTLSKSAYAPAAYQFLDIVNDRKRLPVFAFYSDTYPYRSKKKIGDLITASPTFGYYSWNSYQGMTSYFIERLAQNLAIINYHKDNIAQLDASIGNAEQQGKETLEYSGGTITHRQAQEQRAMERKALEDCLAENEYVEGALQTFTEGDEVLPFKRFRPGRQSGKIEIDDKNGKHWSVEYLPAGYRRILYMVIDIAFRSYLLNKGKSSDGIVIIDEVDLHLHPSLESTIVERLHRTFPQIQFIVSTHSPLVLTNIQPDYSRILRMEAGKNQPVAVEDVYGLDYNTGVEDVMGVDARDVEIDNLLNTLAFMENHHMDQQAMNIRSLLLTKLKGDETHLNKMLERRRKEMGDEIHR